MVISVSHQRTIRRSGRECQSSRKEGCRKGRSVSATRYHVLYAVFVYSRFVYDVFDVSQGVSQSVFALGAPAVSFRAVLIASQGATSTRTGWFQFRVPRRTGPKVTSMPSTGRLFLGLLVVLYFHFSPWKACQDIPSDRETRHRRRASNPIPCSSSFVSSTTISPSPYPTL